MSHTFNIFTHEAFNVPSEWQSHGVLPLKPKLTMSLRAVLLIILRGRGGWKNFFLVGGGVFLKCFWEGGEKRICAFSRVGRISHKQLLHARLIFG